MTEQQQQPAPQQPAKKTGTGLDENVASFLCYLGWWITGIIFLVLEKENKTVRFHAIQSICVFGAFTIVNIILSILGVIPVIGLIFAIISYILWVIAVILWIVLMVKAYQGQKWKLPWASNFAEKNA